MTRTLHWLVHIFCTFYTQQTTNTLYFIKKEIFSTRNIFLHGVCTGPHVLSGTHTLPHSKTRLYCVYYFAFYTLICTKWTCTTTNKIFSLEMGELCTFYHRRTHTHTHNTHLSISSNNGIHLLLNPIFNQIQQCCV